MNNEISPNRFPNTPAALLVEPHTWWAFLNAMRVELGNVVPREPLQINWRFTRFMDMKAPDWGLEWRGSITVRFFVEGHLVRSRS